MCASGPRTSWLDPGPDALAAPSLMPLIDEQGGAFLCRRRRQNEMRVARIVGPIVTPTL